MGRRSALRPEEEPVRERTTPAPPARTATDDVLALQRSAGNRAVSAMLAREPAPADAKAPPAAAATATLPGIGTIPLLSVGFDAGRPVQPPVGRGTDRDAGGPREIVVTSRHGKHSNLLAKAAVSGGSDGEGGLESWTLNFSAMKQEQQQSESE